MYTVLIHSGKFCISGDAEALAQGHIGTVNCRERAEVSWSLFQGLAYHFDGSLEHGGLWASPLCPLPPLSIKISIPGKLHPLLEKALIEFPCFPRGSKLPPLQRRESLGKASSPSIFLEGQLLCVLRLCNSVCFFLLCLFHHECVLLL